MKFNLFYVALLALMITACSGGKKKIDLMNPEIDPNKPGWAEKGGGFFDGDKGTSFYGVGTITRMRNVSLRRTGADTEARADISRIFKSHIANLVKVYQRELTDMDKNASEAFVQDATKAFTSMDLSGAQIIDRYYSVQEQTQYSLAVLDLNSFKDQIEKMNNLSDRAKQIIIENADKAFEEIDALDKK